MLPLIAALGLMGLNAAGSAGGAWYQRRENADAADRVKALLGDQPSLMFPGVDESGAAQQGPPQQVGGSGLMADPTDARRQLDFAQGIMALPPEQRHAAAALFEPMLARAQQQQLARAELSQKGQEFADSQAGINDRFGRELQMHQDQFAEDTRRYGETWALEKLKRNQDIARGRQEMQLNELKLAAARQPVDPNAPQLGAVQAGTTRVMTPQGAVDIPNEGTEQWRTEYKAHGALVSAYQNLQELDASVAEHGTEAYGNEAARQHFLHGRVIAALDALEGTGHTRFSKEKMEELKSQIGDPSGSWNPLAASRLTAAYDEMKKYLRDEYSDARGRTRGWSGFPTDPSGRPLSLDEVAAARAPAGARGTRSAPPPPRGTVPYRPGTSAGPMW